MKRSVSKSVRAGASKGHRGFTLVELLVVIAIIGLLVGLTVPAVLAVRTAFEKGALKMEVNMLHDAIENYKTKHGDYPPDGSNWAITERHLRKAFPNILSSELALLNPANGIQMDPAEALVFFLGGFSTDSQRPFTGKGGPFINVGTAAAPNYRYNGSRQNPFFEFSSDRLTLAGSPNDIKSSDESTFAGATNDLFPVFLSRGNNISSGAPYVYFDSRTYMFNKGTTAAPLFNCYQPSNIVAVNSVTAPRGNMGAVRPYLESVSATGSFQFLNNKTFQIVSAGADGRYGGRLLALGTQWFTGTGQSFTFNGTGMVVDSNSSGKFDLNENTSVGVIRPSHDNSSNFTELRSLGDGAL